MFFSLKKETESPAFSDFDEFVGKAYIVLYIDGCYIFYLALKRIREDTVTEAGYSPGSGKTTRE